MTDEVKCNDAERIWFNKKLIPIKMHYLLFFGGQAAVLPFLSLIARNIGITATALGIIYSTLPFVAFLCVPLLCSFADKHSAVKPIILISVLMTGLSYGSIKFLSTIENNILLDGQMSCTPSNDFASFFKYEASEERSCNLNDTKSLIKCTVSDPVCINKTLSAIRIVAKTISTDACSNQIEYENITELEAFKTNTLTIPNILHLSCVPLNGKLRIKLMSYDKSLTKERFQCCGALNTSCEISCSNFDSCIKTGPSITDYSVYSTHQFWVFLFLMVSSWIFAATVISLSDSLCYHILKSAQESNYGVQRLFGTVGWGSVGSIVGYLYNETKDQTDSSVNYTVGFIIMAVFYIADIALLGRMKLDKDDKEISVDSPNLLTVFYLIIKRISCAWFLLQVFFIGLLTGLTWSYSFWLFQDIGTSHTILGLVMAVQCFLGEAPFFILSDAIIKKIGHFSSVSVSFLAYGIRYLIYGFVTEPWLILPIELLHGPAYSLFYATMTSYASKIAPPKAEASLQGIMSGTFENLGAAIAGLVGGIALDRFGSRKTFITSGLVSFGLCILNLVFCFIFTKKVPRL